MGNMNLYFSFGAGLFLGAVIVYCVMLVAMKHRQSNLHIEYESQKASWDERLQFKEEQYQELKYSHADKEAAFEVLQEANTLLREKLAAIAAQKEEENKAAAEKMMLLHETEQRLSDTFKALSADALHQNNHSFIELAIANLQRYQEGAQSDLQMRQQAIDQMVEPLKESLKRVNDKMQEIERNRDIAYAGLNEQVKSLYNSQMQLQTETSNLVKALRLPNVRGRWGEIQLKRVVEMAGMLEHCDFVQQESVDTDSGRLRPDMIIQLPGGKRVVVDSKVPLLAYLEAMDSSDENMKAGKLKDHARQVKTQINQLGNKAYWEQFQPAPEFVVLFLPGESIFSAALENDPELIEYGVDRKVILATPTTFIALLRAIAYGWGQERIAENAREISELGRTLYERLKVMGGHFENLRKGLNRAVESYNAAAGSLESRVLVSARRFAELGVGGDKELPPLHLVEINPRPIIDEAVSGEIQQDRTEVNHFGES